MTSLEEYISTHTPQGRKCDGALYYRCPKCRGHRKLEVSEDRKKWFCHKCSEGGHLKLKRRLPTGQATFAEEGFLDDYSLLSKRDYAYPLHYLLTYLEERGLSRLDMSILRPHIGPDDSRIYLPLYELGYETPCMFIGRSISPCAPIPYLLPPAKRCLVRKSEVLWGTHRIKTIPKEIVLCEGVFDAIWEPNRLALLGKTLSRAQARIVFRIFAESVTFLLDGGTHEEVRRGVRQLQSVGYTGAIYRIDLEPGRDPDSYWQDKEPLPERERIG